MSRRQGGNTFIGERVRALGTTQKAVAQLVQARGSHCTASYLSLIARGTARATPELYQHLAEVLQCSVAALEALYTTKAGNATPEKSAEEDHEWCYWLVMWRLQQYLTRLPQEKRACAAELLVGELLVPGFNLKGFEYRIIQGLLAAMPYLIQLGTCSDEEGEPAVVSLRVQDLVTGILGGGVRQREHYEAATALVQKLQRGEPVSNEDMPPYPFSLF